MKFADRDAGPEHKAPITPLELTVLSELRVGQRDWEPWGWEPWVSPRISLLLSFIQCTTKGSPTANNQFVPLRVCNQTAHLVQGRAE